MNYIKKIKEIHENINRESTHECPVRVLGVPCTEQMVSFLISLKDKQIESYEYILDIASKLALEGRIDENLYEGLFYLKSKNGVMHLYNSDIVYYPLKKKFQIIKDENEWIDRCFIEDLIAFGYKGIVYLITGELEFITINCEAEFSSLKEYKSFITSALDELGIKYKKVNVLRSRFGVNVHANGWKLEVTPLNGCYNKKMIIEYFRKEYLSP